MFEPGKPTRPKVVAFDIIGTVFPLDPLRRTIIALGLPPSGLESWFAAGCRDAFAMAAVGDYQPFTAVLEGALDQVLAEQDLDPPTHDRKALVKQLEMLEPRAGARDAFATLAEASISVMALSNGASLATKKLLAHGGLGDLVTHIVSVDEVKLAKPRKEVYRYAADRAEIEPAALALVAAHPWDIHGAAAAGLTTAYLDAECPFSSVMRSPHLQGETLVDLARQLTAL